MKREERQKLILDLLARKKQVGTLEILETIPSSPATIRRDLVQMAQDGKIGKTRGKVILCVPDRVPPFELRGHLYDEEKNAIARAAASLVDEGDSIIIDSGTTTLALANQLRERQRLSVITNSIPAAYLFHNTSVTTFVCGGMMDDMALVDYDALAYFTNRRVKKAFLGATGVRGTEGLTVSSSYQYAVKRKMLESAEEKYVLIDSSKFNFMGITLFADFSEITGIVISKPIHNDALLHRLRELGVKIILAAEY